MEGTTGWSDTFAERPTAIWTLPELTEIVVASSPGTPLVLNLAGTTNMTVAVKACTNLADPDWVEVGSVTLVDGTNTLADANSTNYPSRIYCVTPP